MNATPNPDRFAALLADWQLLADGEVLVTRSSELLPVRRGAARAMLKLALTAEEVRGGALMQWWGGVGAARVLARRGAALLLEWAEGGTLAAERDDSAASRQLCAVAARLHTAHPGAPPKLTPLATWFRALGPAAARHGGILALADAAARALLADPLDVVVLHGDLHHGNVLDFGARGWLAIDPKGLLGERGFDYANLFRNPDAARATAPGRLAQQADVVAAAAGLPRERLLRWVMAVAGLSAAWNLSDGLPADADLAVVCAADQARR